MILCKDNAVKTITNPKVVERLMRQGWVEGAEKTEAEGADDAEIDAVRAKLTELGVEFHPRTGLKKLKEMLSEAEGA